VRITFTDRPGSELAQPLAKALGIQLISPTNALDPMTATPSDDIVIQRIIEEIIKNTIEHKQHNGFLLNNYPENVTQAQSLDMALAQAAHPVAASLMIESTKVLQNRENKALIRYYRSQNKLILIDEFSSVEDICSKLNSIHAKRRTVNR